jgi:hypothetical protein
VTSYSSKPVFAFALAALAILAVATGASRLTYAQTAVSGAVAGTVTDQTGALIPGARILLESIGTDSIQSTESGSGGEYRFSLLAPGKYKLKASASGFESTETQVTVNVGTAAAANLKLAIGASTQTVEVAESAPLVQTQMADISTTFSVDQIQNLPNPGNDITFLGQLAPGSVINSTNQAAGGMFGYGNFSSFGLPATSNNFTVNGTDENDPFFNVNDSGATNLLLGNNEIAETSVTSNAYTAQFGGLGGAQLNEITRSGTNRFHGNLVYWWDGRVMNANSYFNNQQGDARPFVNDNQWAASIGGPIKKDKLFFFLDTEGIRLIFPTSTQVFIPSASYESSVLASIAANNPSETSFYQSLFALYNNAPGASGATPYVEAAGPDPDVNTFRSSAASGANEWMMAARLDYTISDHDKLFGRFKMDRGFQPSYTDPINPVFDLISTQPTYEGQLVETHSFSQNIVSQFLVYGSWYSSIFEPANLASTESAFPGTFDFDDAANPATGLTDIFNVISPYGDFQNGRNATQYGVEEDLSIVRGTHSFRVGWNFKRDDISDFDLLEEAYPLDEAFGPYEAAAAGVPGITFNNGYEYVTAQNFPLHPSDPIALYQMGGYVEDDWSATPALKLNLGVRLEHNSNPICVIDCFGRLSSDFYSLASTAAASGNGLTVPYDKLINANQRRTFHGYEHVAVEPRIGITYSPGRAGANVIRAGFGMFADVFPGTVADSELFDPPNDLGFVISGGLLDPALPGSGSAIAASNAAAFRNAFASGGSASSIVATNPSFTPPDLTTSAQQIQYPTYEEWSLQVQHQFGRDTALTLGYVGNHGYHEPVQESSVNAFNDPATSGIAFQGLPATAPLPSFGPVNLIESSSSSNYNGATATLRHREKYADATVNYTYSHALDEISNGGFLPFNPGNGVGPEDPFKLSYNYGNADYDVKHNLTGNYVLTPPAFHSLRTITGNWQLSGTVFYHSGFPYSVTDGNTATGLGYQNFGGTLYADQLGPQSTYHCSTSAIYNPNGTSTPCLDVAGFASATGFGQGSRNAFFGPHYVDTDFSVQKGFLVPRFESAKFTVGAQFFNALNHPNFANPISNIDNPLFGLIDGSVSPPTSIFGNALGGDASPRLVQFKATFQF